VYNLIKGTTAINIFVGIVSIFILWRLGKALLEMELLSEILGAFISVGFIALIIVFQPEIANSFIAGRNTSFFEQTKKKVLFWNFNLNNGAKLNIDPIVKACHKMAASRTGAFIVIAHTNELEEYIESGQSIDASISE
jgi:diadenylate cyclase